MSDLIRLSKIIARVLRHRPDAAGVRLDAQGWCGVDELLKGLRQAGTDVTRAQLDEVVLSNDKNRFSISTDGLRIRASQGHSVSGVSLKLRSKIPPDVLYHGTVQAALPSIEREGLLPMRRHHVHLSAQIATAQSVGARRGTPVVIKVHAHRMHHDGHVFWISDNNVWLTLAVPAKYLET